MHDSNPFCDLRIRNPWSVEFITVGSGSNSFLWRSCPLLEIGRAVPFEGGSVSLSTWDWPQKWKILWALYLILHTIHLADIRSMLRAFRAHANLIFWDSSSISTTPTALIFLKTVWNNYTTLYRESKKKTKKKQTRWWKLKFLGRKQNKQ